jgi:hypothetical protein
MDREKENIRVTGSMDPNTLEGLNINGLGYVEMLIQGTENNVAGFVSDFMDTEEIGLTQWSASRHDEDWISMCIAVPESLYKKILSYGGMEAFISGLNIPFSLDIVFFNPEKMEGLNGDIDILTEKKKGLVVILDESSFNSGATDEKVVGDVIDLVSKFLPRLKKDMLEVMAPETKGLNRDTLKRLGKGKMEKIMEVLVRLKDNYRSYCLEAKSVYQMRMENAFESYEAEKVRIDEVSSLKTYNDNTKNRYFAHYADTKDLMDNNHFVAVPPGLEIQRRRAVQNVNRENDRSCDEFYVVAPHEFMTDASKSVFKKKLMDLWMLEGIVSEENVIILDRKKRPYKTSEIYAMVTEWHEKAGTANTGFRIICGELEYDEDSARRNILQLEIDRNAAHNLDQYQMFINLMSMKGMDNPESFYPDILRKQRAQLYTFTPTACPVDLEDEIRRYYERYKEEILIKA